MPLEPHKIGVSALPNIFVIGVADIQLNFLLDCLLSHSIYLCLGLLLFFGPLVDGHGHFYLVVVGSQFLKFVGPTTLFRRQIDAKCSYLTVLFLLNASVAGAEAARPPVESQ